MGAIRVPLRQLSRESLVWVFLPSVVADNASRTALPSGPCTWRHVESWYPGASKPVKPAWLSPRKRKLEVELP